MIRAAFFDIDGTLLSHKTNSVPDSTLYAIRELQSKGILVFVATGRHKTGLAEVTALDAVRFDGAITLNGQYCYNSDETIYHNPIDPAAIRELMAYLQGHPMSCIFVETDDIYVNYHTEIMRKAHADIHMAMTPLGDLNRGLTNNIYQVILYGTGKELRSMPEFPNTRVTWWHEMGIDLIPANGGKAVGIRKVLEKYGISPGEAIAFGDGDNDIDMLNAVGIGVAMGNASDSVKEQSDYITDSVDDDGILNALEHFGIL